MKATPLVCPKCGATLNIKNGDKIVTCEYCGTKIQIDDEVIHVQLDNAEEAGYQFEKGRQKAQKETNHTEPQRTKITDQATPTIHLHSSPKRKERDNSSGNTVIMWILIIVQTVLYILFVVWSDSIDGHHPLGAPIMALFPSLIVAVIYGKFGNDSGKHLGAYFWVTFLIYTIIAL